jgi:MOSC domain-containing protein YiiM
LPDTMAKITAVLPVEQAVACFASLRAAAETAKATGDERTKAQIKADALVERITGQTTAPAVPVEVQLVMSSDALLGRSDDPAQLPGHGPVPAFLARRIITRDPQAAQARVWVRRLLTDPIDDTVATIDTKRRRFDGALAVLINARDQVCRDPYCNAPIRDLDHLRKHGQAVDAQPVDDPAMSDARLLSVNVLHHVTPGYYGETGIDKRPVEGAVEVDASGLVGDRQLSRGHGGPDKAVYAYASEDTAWWSEQLGRDLKPGVFGENLTTSGLDVTGALLGERWQIGTVELEVRMPRTPCQNLSQRVGVTGFHRDFNRSGRVGALLAVHSPGRIAAGDEVSLVSRPDHDVTIAVMAIGPDSDQLERLLDSGVPLARSVRAKAQRAVRRR